MSSIVLILQTVNIMAQSTNYEKYMANQKSIGATLALQIFFPGAGNAYVGQSPIKIIAYPTLYAFALVCAFAGGATTHDKDQKATWFVLGISGASLINIIGTIDAVSGCNKFNGNLRKKYDLVFNSNSLKLTYNF
jgi:hypothetical protein